MIFAHPVEILKLRANNVKSFIKTIVTPTLFALSASAWAIGPSECPRILVTNYDISVASHQVLQEAVRSFPPHSNLLQLGDFFLLRDTKGFNRRIRYLQAVKILDFRQIAEESIRDLDLSKTKPPFFFSSNGKTFYLVTADQLKDIQNIPETFIKSMAGLTLPDLPQVPVRPQPVLLGSQVQSRQVVKVPKLTQIEWTTKKKSQNYFAPQASRLSANKPLLIITWWNRPGWAAVDAEYLRDNGPSRVRDLIRSETQVTLTDSVYTALTKYLENPLNQSALASNKLSTQGMGRMNEAVIQQGIFVAEEPTSHHRLIILPLMVQDTPAKTGAAKAVVQASPARPMSVPKPAPPPVPPTVHRTQSPLNRGPKRAPLVPVNDWVSDIYAPEAPPLVECTIIFCHPSHPNA